MANKLQFLIFIALSISLSLSHYNDESNEIQIIKGNIDNEQTIIVNGYKLYVVTKAESKDLVLSHSIKVPKGRKSLENYMLYTTSKTLDNISTLNFISFDEKSFTIKEDDDMIEYTGIINVKEGDYAITLIFGLEKGESVVAKTFIMPRYVAVFIAINVVLGILLLFALTILFIKKYCCRD